MPEQTGSITAAWRDGATVLREQVALQASHAVTTALLDKSALAARYPWMQVDDVLLGSLGMSTATSGEGWFDGYAAMQALVKTPDLFQCAINYVGVTDLQLFHSVTWSDSSDTDFMRYLFPIMVGDPERDVAQLKATSPAQNAERISKPVFMAYGGEDRRVPLIHGERMRDALLRLGKPVEWMVKTDEGHGYAKFENRVEFYSKMEAFLARHLPR